MLHCCDFFEPRCKDEHLGLLSCNQTTCDIVTKTCLDTWCDLRSSTGCYIRTGHEDRDTWIKVGIIAVAFFLIILFLSWFSWFMSYHSRDFLFWCKKKFSKTKEEDEEEPLDSSPLPKSQYMTEEKQREEAEERLLTAMATVTATSTMDTTSKVENSDPYYNVL